MFYTVLPLRCAAMHTKNMQHRKVFMHYKHFESFWQRKKLNNKTAVQILTLSFSFWSLFHKLLVKSAIIWKIKIFFVHFPCLQGFWSHESYNIIRQLICFIRIIVFCLDKECQTMFIILCLFQRACNITWVIQ